MYFSIPFINHVSYLDKLLFVKNLALLIKAGLPLRESVITIQEQAKSKTFKKVLDDVLKSIDNGQSLAASISRHPRIFSTLYINMIRIGEESGTLEENLKYLGQQLEKNHQLRVKVKAAMLYPAIILSTTIVLGLGLTLFILPKIIPVFKALNIELPLITRILIRITEIIQNYGLFILIGIFVLITVFVLTSRLRIVKFSIHKFILRLPILGSFSRNINISHFSRTSGILLRSGLPVVNTLDITQTTLENLVYQKELKSMVNEVKRGKPISSYLRKREFLFPLMVSRMVGVGEKTGKLEETLMYLGSFYEAEVDKSIKSLTSIFEPILLLIIGLMVGLIALAIISPIYEITSGLHF